MKEPLVSVIVPCFNAEKFVRDAVLSICNQSYKNLEIIIADDCSTDNTSEILEQLSKVDHRIKLVRHKTNLKIVKTLNELVACSEGKYIARMDADDISLPTRIEKQVNFLEAHSDVSVCGTNAIIIDENDKQIERTYLPILPEDNKYFLRFFSTLYHPTILAKSEVLKQNLYDESFLYIEDYELWCRLVFSNGLKICNLQEPLYKYRVFPASTSSVHAAKQKASSARLFDLYPIIPNENIDVHKNIFFLQGNPQPIHSILEYINECQNQLKQHDINSSCTAEEKIFYYLKKHKLHYEMIKLAGSKLGRLTIRRKLQRKIAQKA